MEGFVGTDCEHQQISSSVPNTGHFYRPQGSFLDTGQPLGNTPE